MSSLPLDRAAYERDGFLALPEPVVGPADAATALARIERLIERLEAKRSPEVRDLAAGGEVPGRILEVERVIELSRELAASPVVSRCRAVATDLLGTPAALYYDHVILKPPRTAAPTAWHADAAYTPDHDPPPAAHIWVALHDVGVDGSCMRFIPGSHTELVPHRPLGDDPAAAALQAIGVDESRAVECPLPAGGVTVHQPRTLHGSGPNRTDRHRVAWILQFRPVDSWRRPPAARRALHVLRRRARSAVGR